jgi:hypothetical protein
VLACPSDMESGSQLGNLSKITHDHQQAMLGHEIALPRAMKGGRHGPKEQKRDLREVHDGFVYGKTSTERGHAITKSRQTSSDVVHTTSQALHAISEDASIIEKRQRMVKLESTVAK